MLVEPVLAWSFYVKVGWGTCTADLSVPALCQAVGGWRGSLSHSCLRGSELGLHSTGVCLSFCLIPFIIVSSFSYFITLEVPRQNVKDWFVHFLLFASFSGKDTVLMHKMLSRILSGFLDQDSVKRFLRFLGFELCYFPSFWLKKEIISRHCAMAGCFYCMH